MTKKHVLFIQGGGDDGYAADQALADSLKTELGSEYEVSYPELVSDESSPDYGWTKQITKEISSYKHPVIIVAHSFGASMMLKYLSEQSVSKNIVAVFLLATPHWDGGEDWQKGLMLKKNFADKIPTEFPIHFYHCQDDEEIPFSHVKWYKEQLSKAIFHDVKTGGHQFNNDLTQIASDIKSLS